MPASPFTVAIFNASDDTVDMLAELLRANGFTTVNGHVADVKRGVTDFLAFIAEHDPHAIIWDISPPYDQNWTFFTLLRSSSVLVGRGMVVTTTHKKHLDTLVGLDSGAIEIVGKPYDLNLILQAVRSAIPAV